MSDFKNFLETVNVIESEKAFSEHEKEILKLIMFNGKLRSVRPKFDKTKPITGEAYYVWRMTQFFISDKKQHHCMPVTADMYLVCKFDEVRQITKRLDVLVDKIVNSIPLEEWHGVRRWSQAWFGY